MPLKTRRWDSAKRPKTDDDIRNYLEAALEEDGNDPDFIVHALGVIARSGNVSQLARDTGLSREGIYKALSEDGNPSFATVARIATALGLRIKFESVA